MRWLAVSVFLMITLGCIYLALVAFVQPDWTLEAVGWSMGMTPAALVGVGIGFLVLGACSVGRGLWVWRSWRDPPS